MTPEPRFCRYLAGWYIGGLISLPAVLVDAWLIATLAAMTDGLSPQAVICDSSVDTWINPNWVMIEALAWGVAGAMLGSLQFVAWRLGEILFGCRTGGPVARFLTASYVLSAGTAAAIYFWCWLGAGAPGPCVFGSSEAAVAAVCVLILASSIVIAARHAVTMRQSPAWRGRELFTAIAGLAALLLYAVGWEQPRFAEGNWSTADGTVLSLNAEHSGYGAFKFLPRSAGRRPTIPSQSISWYERGHALYFYKERTPTVAGSRWRPVAAGVLNADASELTFCGRRAASGYTIVLGRPGYPD